MTSAWVVYVKELIDALRDRRTLFAVLLSAVLLGPLVLVAMSALVARLEDRADERVVVVQGLPHAPGLANFLARQSIELREAPADYEAQLRAGRLTTPVLIVPEGFETALARGEGPALTLVGDAANANAQAAEGSVERWVGAYGREISALSLALRGVGPAVVQPFELHHRELASTATRGAQFTGLLPFFVLMAMLYGALNAALDTTAGERERGSLEPLLANPASRWSLVCGKWGAVTTLGLLLALLASLSFVPAQWLLRSELLRSLFRFGAGEVLAFLLVLAPFAAALSAVLMAVAVHCRSVKEAQAATNGVLLAVSLMPLVTLLNPGAESPWQLWVPALAQNTLMTRVLKGEALGWSQWAPAAMVCAVLTVAGLAVVVRALRSTVLRG